VTTDLPSDLGQRQPLSTRAKSLIWIGGVLLLASMLVTGVFAFLLAPPDKVMVVFMQPGSGETAREQLKSDCGRLPGVEVVADKGNPDPDVQGRFPVRFQVGEATSEQEAALQACVARHDDIVRGFLFEGG
jgi:hypothetical protein